MSFVTQEDVFAAIEPVMHGVFEEFAERPARSRPTPFPRIPYDEAMLDYGSDKPDLRNPLRIADVTDIPRRRLRPVRPQIAEDGGVVRAIPAPGAGGNRAASSTS